MKPPFVLIDASYLAHRALHSMGGLTHDGEGTAILFGFFHQLRSLCQSPRVASNRVAVFFDSKTSLRRAAYPDYKAKRRSRPKDPERAAALKALHRQVDRLREDILPSIGVCAYHAEGLESDDLLAVAAAQETARGRESGVKGGGPRAIIVTADADLWQCISPWVHWYDQGRDLYYDPRSFMAEKGLPARRWKEVKQIAGCRSDNVKGIRGIGDATAVRYLLGTLKASSKAHAKIVSEEGGAVVRRNHDLVVLPHPEAPAAVKLRSPKWHREEFVLMCKKHCFQSMLDEWPKWERFFRGDRMRALLRRLDG